MKRTWLLILLLPILSKAQPIVPFKDFHTNGKVFHEGQMQDGLKVGLWTTWDNQGGLRGKIHYGIIQTDSGKISVFDGPYETWDYKGLADETGTYAKGLKEGVWRKYYGDKLYREDTYRNGKLEGPFRHFATNTGYLEAEGTHIESEKLINGYKVKVYGGLRKTYYPDGKLKSSVELDDQGKQNSLEETYHANGQLATRCLYVHGQKTGPYQAWDQQGRMTTDVMYVLREKEGTQVGMKHGLERHWTQGVLTFEGQNREDKTHGPWTRYFPDGALQQTGQFEDGLVVGELRSYHPNGKPKMMETYRIVTLPNGERKSIQAGMSRTYDQNGSILKAVCHDSTNTSIILDYQDGKLNAMSLPGFFEYRLGPNGQLLNFTITLQSRTGYACHYFQDGSLRKLTWQDPDRDRVYNVLLDDAGTITHIDPEPYPGPPVLPSDGDVKSVLKAWNKKVMPNPLFSDQVHDGSYTVVLSGNKLFARLGFEKDLPHGDWLFRDPLTGDTIAYRHYTQGIQDGYFVSKFGGKELLVRGRLRDGKGLPWSEYFWPPGHLHSSKYTQADGSELSREYHDNGQLERENNYKRNVFKSYDEAGRPTSTHLEVAGQPRRRLSTTYHPGTDKPSRIQYHLDGSMDSLCTTFYPTGELQSVAYYKLGKRHGPYKQYHQNGKLKMEGQFVDDLQDGEWTIYEDPKPSRKQQYRAGNLQVSVPDYPCACIDTLHSTSKVRFMNPLSAFMKKEQVAPRLFHGLRAVDGFNFDDIYCHTYGSNGNGNTQYASFELSLYNELALDIGPGQAFRLILTPCRTMGYIGRMDGSITFNPIDPRVTELDLRPEKVALSFPHAPLKTAGDHERPYRALFPAHEVNYDAGGSLYLKPPHPSRKAPAPCYPPGEVPGLLKVQVIRAYPALDEHTFPLPPSPKELLNLQIPPRNHTGLLIDEASVELVLTDSNTTHIIQAKCVRMYLGADHLAGLIHLPFTGQEGDHYTFTDTQGKTLRIHADRLKALLLRQGCDQVIVFPPDFGDYVRIPFYIKSK